MEEQAELKDVLLEKLLMLFTNDEESKDKIDQLLKYAGTYEIQLDIQYATVRAYPLNSMSKQRLNTNISMDLISVSQHYMNMFTDNVLSF